MGLLDEAIREHLELKRRRGADPTEVAREEHEALTPIFSADHADSDGDDGLPAPQDGHDGEAPTPVVGSLEGAEADSSGGDADLSRIGQETAELDMQAVMEEDGDDADGDAPPPEQIAGAPLHPGPSETLVEEPLSLEAAGELDGQSAVDEAPGQERLSFD